MPVKRHHVRPEVPAVIFQWGGSARRGGGAACSQASGTASETECVKAAEEMRGDWEGQGAVWGTSVRSEAERESGARGGLTCPAVDKGVRDGDNPLALLLVSLSCVRHRAEGFSWMLGTAARQWGAWDPGEMRRGPGFQELGRERDGHESQLPGRLTRSLGSPRRREGSGALEEEERTDVFFLYIP